jgi:hypothetical protein
MSIHRPTVLILASDPAFAREITAHWPQDPVPHSDAPEFIVLDGGFSRGLQGCHYDLAIADAASAEKHASQLSGPVQGVEKTDEKKDGKKKDDRKNEEKRTKRNRLNRRLNRDLKQSLTSAGKPAILIHCDPSLDFYNIHGAVLELRRERGLWPALTGLIGREILRRVHAEARTRQADEISSALQSEATLGRYMVEMRTNVNNALTTVLGNAELLALEPGLPAAVQVQADTIRHMALRLHEVFQRFYSIEKELSVDARESGKKVMSAAAGR